MLWCAGCTCSVLVSGPHRAGTAVARTVHHPLTAPLLQLQHGHYNIPVYLYLTRYHWVLTITIVYIPNIIVVSIFSIIPILPLIYWYQHDHHEKFSHASQESVDAAPEEATQARCWSRPDWGFNLRTYWGYVRVPGVRGSLRAAMQGPLLPTYPHRI